MQQPSASVCTSTSGKASNVLQSRPSRRQSNVSVKIGEAKYSVQSVNEWMVGRLRLCWHLLDRHWTLFRCVVQAYRVHVSMLRRDSAKERLV